MGRARSLFRNRIIMQRLLVLLACVMSVNLYENQPTADYPDTNEIFQKAVELPQIIKKNYPPSDMVRVLRDKRGTAPPAIEIPFQQQQEDEDYNNEILQDLDIVLWRTTKSTKSWNLKYPIIVTRRDQSSLHERLETVRFRVCNDELTKNVTTQKEHPPPCPKPLDAYSNQSLGEQFMSNPDIKILIWENKTTLGDISRRDLVHQMKYVSYWSTNQKRHILLQLKDKVEKRACRGHRCPQLCTRVTRDELLRGFHHAPMMWDQKDSLCKETHPSTYGGACSCSRTCFTPAVNQLNSTWPWTSAAERNQFYPNNTYIQHPPPQCVNLRNKQPAVPRYACDAVSKSGRQHISSSGYTDVAGNPRNNLTLTCPIQVAGMHHVMFIPEAKLVFCGIPKVGITEWTKFFRFTFGAGDYLSLPHFKADRKDFLVQSLPLDKAQDLWNDPSWTKAVFFRDPAERLLSAYLNKVVSNGYTQKVFGIGKKTDNPRPMLTFAEFVDLLASNNTDCGNPRGLHTCSDPHWAAQFMTAGLDVLLPLIDFVGNFNHISEHTKLLLERVGMWDSYGRLFDDGSFYDDINSASSSCNIPPPPLIENSTKGPLGFNQRDRSQVWTTQHLTGAQRKIDTYYTPELMAKVRKIYEVDYAIFDDISKRSVSDVARGRDLKHVQSYCRQEGINL